MEAEVIREVSNSQDAGPWIRDMTESDLGTIFEIERKCFNHVWTQQMFRTSLAQRPLTQSWVAIRDQHIVGYLIASYIPRYAEQEGEVHISNIAVEPECQREGIGKMLLQHALEYGDRHLCDSVSLEVRVSNQPARAFYRRYGFINVGLRPRYYGNEDAILMEASLSNALNLMQQGE